MTRNFDIIPNSDYSMMILLTKHEIQLRERERERALREGRKKLQSSQKSETL